MSRIILDLCGGTGSWSAPYRAAGYDVRLVTLPENDVRWFHPPKDVHGILAAPPCTEFAVSGARWWKAKPPELLAEAADVVEAVMSIIAQCKPAWWALENPVGRLGDYIGKWKYTFQPWEYGDPWVKRTCVWGDHVQPTKSPCDISRIRNGCLGRSSSDHRHPQTIADFWELAGKPALCTEWIHRLPPGNDRAALRSITPPRFAKAFFEANT